MLVALDPSGFFIFQKAHDRVPGAEWWSWLDNCHYCSRHVSKTARDRMEVQCEGGNARGARDVDPSATDSSSAWAI